MNYVFAVAILLAPKSSYGERNFLPSGNRVRSNGRGIAKNSRQVIHKKSDAPTRRRNLRANRRDLRNDRLPNNFSMSLQDESSTFITSTDSTPWEASMSLSTVIASTLPATPDSAVSMSIPEAKSDISFSMLQLAGTIATFSMPILDEDFMNFGGIVQPVVSMSVNVHHDTNLFSLSMPSSEENFFEFMEKVNSVTSLSMPKASGDLYYSILLLPSTEAPIYIATPFSLTLVEEAFEEYESAGEYIYSMSMSNPRESTNALLSMPSPEEDFSDYIETGDSVKSMSMFQAKSDFSFSMPSLPSSEPSIRVSSPFSIRVIEGHFAEYEISGEYIDSMSMSIPGESTHASLSMPSVGEDFFDYTETVNSVTSMSMLEAKNDVSFSMPLLPSAEAPIGVSTPYPMEIVEEDFEEYRIDENSFASISMSLPNDNISFSYSTPSFKEDFSYYTDTVKSFSSMSFPEENSEFSISMPSFPGAVAPMVISTPFSMSMVEGDFEEYYIVEKSVDSTSMSLPDDTPFFSFSMSLSDKDTTYDMPPTSSASTAEEDFKQYNLAVEMSMREELVFSLLIQTEQDFNKFLMSMPSDEYVSMSVSMDVPIIHIPAQEEITGLTMPTFVSLSMSTQEQDFDGFGIPPKEEDGLDGIGDWWWPESSMAEVDHSMSLSLSTTSDIMPVVVSLSMRTQEQGFDKFEIPTEEDTDFSGFSLPAEASFSFSVPEDGLDGIGDWWWTEFSMAEVDRSVSLSLSTTSNIMPILVSLSMSMQGQGLDRFDFSPEEDADFSAFILPADMSFSFSIPENGLHGIGDWWWTEFSMAEVDRSVSLSLSTTGDIRPIVVSLSMSTQEQGLDEFEFLPEEDTASSGFILPADGSLSFSVTEDGLDGIGDWWWTEFSMAEVDRSVSLSLFTNSDIMPISSMSMQEQGFDEFEIPSVEETAFSGFSLPADASLSLSILENGLDGIGDWWWTEFSMAQVDRSMSLSLSTTSNIMPIVVSLSMSTQGQGLDDFGIPPEEDTDFSGFSLPAEASFDFSIPEDGLDGIGDWWWTEFSMAEVDHSVSSSLSIPSDIRPIDVSLSMSAQGQGFDDFEIPPEEDTDFSGFSLPAAASFGFSISEDGLDGIGDWWWTEFSMAEFDRSMSLSPSTTSDMVSLSTTTQGQGLDELEIPPEEDTDFSAFIPPAEASFSFSSAENGLDGIGDWWWTEFSMAEDDRSVSLSLSTSSDITPIVVSISLSMQGQGFDELKIPPEEETAFYGFILPEEASFSFSVPDDGLDGIGDWWWTEFSMAEVDRSMSLSLSISSDIMPILSMSMQEQGFDEFEYTPEEDADFSEFSLRMSMQEQALDDLEIPPNEYTDFSGFSLPAEASFSFSIPKGGLDGIGDWWWTEFSMAEVDRSVSLSLSTTTEIMPISSMSMQEQGFDEFEFTPKEDPDFSGFSLPADMSFSFSIPKDGLDGFGDWWWTELSMAEVDRSMSSSLSIPSDTMPIVVSLSMSMQGQGFDKFEIPREEDTDSSGFSLPSEVNFSISISEDGLGGIDDWWWTELSMAEVERSMSLSLSIPKDIPTLEQSGTDFEALETFSNDLEEFEFSWVN